MNVQFPQRTDVGNHTVQSGLEMEWLDEGSIVTFTLTKSTRQVVDAYFQINMQLMEEMDNERPDELFVSLHDVSHPDMSLTPHMKERLSQIAERINVGKTQHRSAVILKNDLFGSLFSIFGNTFSRSAKNTTQQYFTTREKGLAWLRLVQPQTSVSR